jgi:hypothetical protein
VESKHENDKTILGDPLRRHAACADANDGDSGRYDNGGRYGGRAARRAGKQCGSARQADKGYFFHSSDSRDRDIGVYLGEGCYTIDLNGMR